MASFANCLALMWNISRFLEFYDRLATLQLHCTCQSFISHASTTYVHRTCHTEGTFTPHPAPYRTASGVKTATHGAVPCHVAPCSFVRYRHYKIALKSFSPLDKHADLAIHFACVNFFRFFRFLFILFNERSKNNYIRIYWTAPCGAVPHAV